MSNWRHPYSLGGGVVLGLVVAGHAWLVFLAGVVVGALLVVALRLLRRSVRVARLLGRAGLRRLEQAAGEPTADATPPPAGELTPAERELERRVGLRQGEAQGIRSAARLEVREQARREAMDEALDRHWREQRQRSLERTIADA